ncbi:hypothetical protein QTQ03_08480 [Micromonospora sp. WMMA1363]|uniref:hypothetical protein n=1 Tax=Micromonospora sp. WMMA1363 TaxID=3053985 RepID=UPI00259CDD77|nr:hypothetical protein [Micromonospora sp. WMMA1363]MDM4719618.1 hypothetical protein [Micromonospora sp. WMMA1363]
MRYVEAMKPGYVDAVAEECLRAKKVIRVVSPTLDGLRGRVEWSSDADRYEQRLRETIDLVDGLHDGFDKAGAAIAGTHLHHGSGLRQRRGRREHSPSWPSRSTQRRPPGIRASQ